MGGSASAARSRAPRCGRGWRGRWSSRAAPSCRPWAGPDTLVLCSSYSGNTEETLAAYDAAGEAGAPRVVSSSGGELPPAPAATRCR